MKSFFVTGIVLLIFLSSCAPQKTNIIICDLSRSDYTEAILATGTVQAVNSLTISPPADYYGALTVGWIKPEGSLVEKGDSICILKCDEMMRMLDEELKNLENLQADFKKLEADNILNQVVLEARLKENQAGMSITQLDSVQMRFAPPVKKQLMALELEKARVEEKKLKKKFLAEKAIDETEVRQLKSRILQAENKVQTMQDKVKGLTILAPASGMLSHSETRGLMMMRMDGTIEELGGYPKAGAMIYPQIPLIALPDLSMMQIKLEVQEIDYKRIDKGQKVNVAVDAAGGLRTTGFVKLKSLTGKTEYSGQSKMKLYEVIVSLDSCHTRMSPGLSARCDILISQVKDTVVVPTLAIFERDSLKIVYVAGGDKFRPVTVETGLSNSSQTIVSRGLSGKETIALVEPPQNYIEKPKNSIHE